MTLSEMIKWGSNALLEAGIPKEQCDSDAKLLAMDVLAFSFSDVLLNYSNEVNEGDCEHFREYIELRKTHMPCQYITKSQNFYGFDFSCEEGVLIPRPETELLVEKALKTAEVYESCKVLDLCCGSGCIGISFYLTRKNNGYINDLVTLADISDDAVALSKKNVERLKAGCNIIKSDLFSNIDTKYNIIISNPPYIRSEEISDLMPEVRDFEPHLALDGSDDGLYFYSLIIREARSFLYDGGALLFETGHDQFEDIRRLFVDAGYRDIEQIYDYAGLDRVILGYKS